MTGTLDTYRDLPPAQALVMEVLAARARLGEPYWTFSTRHRGLIAALELKGLVASKSGIVERTCLAWLTDKGREATQSATYKAPAVAELDDLKWLLGKGFGVRVTPYLAFGPGPGDGEMLYEVVLSDIEGEHLLTADGQPSLGAALAEARKQAEETP